MNNEEEARAEARAFSRSRAGVPVRTCPRCGQPFWSWEEYFEHAWDEQP